MKIPVQECSPAALPSKRQSPQPATRGWLRSHCGRLLALGAVIVAANSQRASAQVATAGNVIANLQSSDLNASSPTWQNRATGTFSVGNFTTIGGANANVQTVNGFKGLYVNTTAANGMLSAVTIPSSITGNNSFTVEAWVNTNNLYSGFDSHNIVASYGPSASNINFGYGPTGNGSDAFNPGNFNDLGYQTNPPTGSWALVDYTYNSSTNTATVYVNGSVNVTGQLNNLSTQASQFYLGTQFNQSNPFAGYIGALRVEDGVLSQSAISNNYALGVGGTVVPEPSTVFAAIFMCGSGMFVRWRQRRQRA